MSEANPDSLFPISVNGLSFQAELTVSEKEHQIQAKCVEIPECYVYADTIYEALEALEYKIPHFQNEEKGTEL